MRNKIRLTLSGSKTNQIRSDSIFIHGRYHYLILFSYCGSSDIQLVLRKGKRWRAMGAAIISALMVIPPGDNQLDVR